MEKSKNSIKILVCYHKKFPLLKDEILTPIHLGRSRSNKENAGIQWLYDNMIGDDTGENISDKNAYYNEMTALYWAWKNYDELGNPDYIGLAHYRRHFVCEENVEKTYSIRYYDQDNILETLNYTPEKMHQIVDGCDFVTHIGRVYNLYEHYIDNQREDDIDIAMEILKEKFPEYADTADAYMAGQTSNFYNMSIFSKELFFQYCEFVFSIMEEFEVRQPSVLNRRMFISERLSAIFVKKLMDSQKYNYKVLPVAFIEEPLDVNIAAYVTNDNVKTMAVSFQSVLHHSNAYNRYVFYVINDGTLKQEFKDALQEMIEGYENCVVKFIKFLEPEDHLPLKLAFLLPNIPKCLLITDEVIATTDLAEFYRLIVVDDFFVSGIPATKYDQMDKKKQIASDMLMLNCRRIRSNTTEEQYNEWLKDGKDGIDVLNERWGIEIKYIAYYWYVSERLFRINSHVYLNNKERGQLQLEATWCPVIVYDGEKPFLNSQGVYANFWWDSYLEVPQMFKNIEYNENLLESIWKRQLDEIWKKQNLGIVDNSLHVVHEVPANNSGESEVQVVPVEDEAWRSYGLWGKLKFYYDHNGAKKTVWYVGQKIFGNKEESQK